MPTDVPAGWRSAALAGLGDEGGVVQTGPFGAQLHADDYQSEGVPFILIKNIRDGYLDTKGIPFISEADAARLAKYQIRAGDIVFSRVGRVGSCFLAQAQHQGWVISGQTLRVRTNPESVDSSFLTFALRSDAVQSYIAGTSLGSTRKSINTKILESTRLLVPPLPEQKKIAAILSAVDEAIQATQAVIEQTRRVKEGLLQELLTSPDTPRVRIAEVGEAQLGQQRHPKFLTGTNIRPYLRVANVLDGRIDFGDLKKMHFPEAELGKFELLPGDILLNEGQSTHLVGRSAMYRGEIPGLCVQKTLLRYRCGPRLIPDFAQAVFQHWLWSGHFAEIAVQTTSMAHLTGVRFKRMWMPVPPIDEQRRIVGMVGSVASTAMKYADVLCGLQQVKAGLLQDLLTGKVRVSV